AKAWAVGTWTFTDNIVHLIFTDIYDTLARTAKPDSLVLSADEKSDRITGEEFAFSQLASGGQKRVGMTDQLVWRRNKLYLSAGNGQPLRWRFRESFGEKKRPLWL